jgi:release factor glutamine methyltransferase
LVVKWAGGNAAVTVVELLALGAGLLPRREGIPDPRRETQWLLAHAWGVAEVWLRLHPESGVPEQVEHRFRDWIGRRAAGEPAHHLTGLCTFWSREFAISSKVLVPRPETELIVQVALELPITHSARVLDVGTGSGCLAVTLAAERPGWQVMAVDRSLAAIEIAAGNARRHQVPVQLLAGDLADALVGGFDLVVANLPYLPSGRLAGLPIEVRHDPLLALDGGDDGLALIRRLLTDLLRLLKECGGAVLELDQDQAEALTAVAEASGLVVARRVRDLAGSERVIVFQRR